MGSPDAKFFDTKTIIGLCVAVALIIPPVCYGIRTEISSTYGSRDNARTCWAFVAIWTVLVSALLMLRYGKIFMPHKWNGKFQVAYIICCVLVGLAALFLVTLDIDLGLK